MSHWVVIIDDFSKVKGEPIPGNVKEMFVGATAYTPTDTPSRIRYIRVEPGYFIYVFIEDHYAMMYPTESDAQRIATMVGGKYEFIP
jgi:hypothetical protein